MSQPSVVWWQPCVGNEAEIAALQNVEQDSKVVLNSGRQETPGTFEYNKMIRSILFHSPDDLTGVRFIISGIGCEVDGKGNPIHILSHIIEHIDGQNGVPVQSTRIYSQINSITIAPNLNPPTPATNLTIGFGRFGITDYVFFGYNRISASLSSYSLQFIKPPGTSIKAGVYTSLNKPEYPNIAQGGILEPFGTENGKYITFIPAFQLVDPDNDGPQIGQVLGATCVTWATVKDTSLAVEDSLYFTFLQPGVSS